MKQSKIIELLNDTGTVYVSHIDFKSLPKRFKQRLDNCLGKATNYKNGIVYRESDVIDDVSSLGFIEDDLIHGE